MGVHPFEASDKLKIQRRIIKGHVQFPSQPFLSSELQHLILQMLEQDFTHRIKLVDIYKTPWIQAAYRGDSEVSFSMEQDEPLSIQPEYEESPKLMLAPPSFKIKKLQVNVTN